MEHWQSLYVERYGEAPSTPGPAADAVSAAERVVGRRTIRRYLDRDVDAGHLELLFACAQSAPAKSDLQQYSIIHITARETREIIGDLLASMPWVRTAPVLLMFCGDVRRNRRICELRGHAYANNNTDTFMNAAVDAALAMGFLISGAEATGLGCCPLSMVRNHLEKLAGLLGLPDGVFPVAGLTIGWPADASRTSLRLPSRLVVHRDRYDDTSLESLIDDYDGKRLERQPIPPEKQRHVDRYGALENARWSENIARQLSFPERDNFAAWLNARGISLD